MSTKQKKISPLDIEFEGGRKRIPNWLDKLPSDEFRQFLAEARELFRTDQLPNVTGTRDFFRFVVKARDDHWPGVELPKEGTIGRWVNEEAA